MPLLQMEIGRLEEENKKLRSRLDNKEMECTNNLQDQGVLQQQVEKLSREANMTSHAPDVQVKNLMKEVRVIMQLFTGDIWFQFKPSPFWAFMLDVCFLLVLCIQ